MTLSQLVFVADQALGEYDTSLREIKDTLVALEPVQPLINDAVAAGVLTEQQATTVKTRTIAEILQQFNLENVTVDKLVALLFSAASGGIGQPADKPETPETQSEISVDFDLAAAIDYLKAMLKETTLSQLGMMFPDLDGFAFSKAKMGAELIIGKTEVEKSELNGEVGFAQTVGETSVGEIQAKVSYKIETNDSEISLPEDVKVIYAIWMKDFQTVSDSNDCMIVFYPPILNNENIVGEGYISITSYDQSAYTEYRFEYILPESPEFTSVSIVVTEGYGVNGALSDEELKEIFAGTTSIKLQIENGIIDLSDFPIAGVYSVTF